MTDEDYHKAKAEIAMARFLGADNPFTGEAGEDGVKLRRRGYFEIANEITDEEIRAHWTASRRRANTGAGAGTIGDARRQT